jgi:exodeoxyribonuclease X
MQFLVLDTETTGLDATKDRVVEVGYALTSLTEPLESGSALVNPGIPIPPEASAIHHLVDADVENALKLDAAVATTFPRFVGIHAAHNAPFDAGFLPMIHGPWLCTKRMAMRYLPDLPSFSNQYLRYALKLEVPSVKGMAAHRAEADAIVTASLLRYLLCGPAAEDLGNMETSSFLAKQAEPVLIKTVSFGKHKGKPWSQVPVDYLQWFSRNSEGADADVLFTVKHWLGK